MQVPRPNGRAERQVTHPLTSGSDGWKQAVHEGARDSLSLVCRGGHPAEHPGCVVWDAAGTHKRPWQGVAFFSRQGEESERSGITLPDARGWSTQSDRREWVTLSLRVGNSRREASRRAKQCDLTESPVTKKHKGRHMHHKRACMCA